MEPVTLTNQTGVLRIEPTADGRLSLHAQPAGGLHTAHTHIVTDYPLELIREIFSQFGAGYSIDEIGRDQDDNDAQLDVRYSVLAFFPDELLQRPLRILDYGCGSGSSTLALTRLFPNASIAALDFVPGSLRIARLRQAHYGLANVEFRQVQSSGEQLTRDHFDMVFLNAVYEHLLPPERPVILQEIWNSLKPGGSLVLNQTPHRWFPVETHTSGLPLVNYLPAPLTRLAQMHLSKRSFGTETWEQMLRRGIRGATVSEIMGNIRRVDAGATLLRPIRISNSWPGIWYAAKRKRQPAGLMSRAIGATESFVTVTGLPLTPYINIAVTKSPVSRSSG